MTTSPPHVQVETASRSVAPVRSPWPPLPDVLAVGVTALAVRLAVIAAIPENIPFADMVDYHERAEALLDGQSLSDSFRGPGYPGWLALLYTLPLSPIFAARFGNALLAAITAMLTMVLAREFAGRRATLMAGAIVAVYPASVLSTAYLMPEGLYGVLILLALLVARQPSPGRGAIAGALAAVAALTRSLGIALVPALAAGYLWSTRRDHRWRTPVLTAAAMGLACLVTLTPWLQHTLRVSGGLMLDSASAYNVLIGANPRARERLQIEDGNWVRATYLAGARHEADQNQRALTASWAWIRTNPGSWLRLVPLKMGYLWGLEGREHAWAYSQSYLGRHEPATVRAWGYALLWCLPPLTLLAAVGLFRPGLTASTTGIAIATLLALVTLMHGMSFSETRYHLPLVPLLAVLAARGVSGAHPLTARRWLLVALVAAALAAGWWRQLPELLERFAMLATPDGWRLMLRF